MRLVEALTKFELDDGQLSALASSNDDAATRAILTDAVEQWNKSNAKKLERFISIVVDSLMEFGTDSNSNNFLYFLENADDSDIKQISRDLAEQLIEFCDKFGKSQIQDHVVEGKGLFTEGAKNISYKLKILQIFLTPSELKKYKNESGKELTINDLYDPSSGKMKTTLEIKKLASKAYSDTPDDGRPLKDVLNKFYSGKKIFTVLKGWLSNVKVRKELKDPDEYVTFVTKLFFDKTKKDKEDEDKKQSFLNQCFISGNDTKTAPTLQQIGQGLEDYRNKYSLTLSDSKRSVQSLIRDYFIDHKLSGIKYDTPVGWYLFFNYIDKVFKKTSAYTSLKPEKQTLLNTYMSTNKDLTTDEALNNLMVSKVSVGEGSEKEKFLNNRLKQFFETEAVV